MTSDNKTFMLILNILFMAPRMVLLISEDERKENGSDSESDSGDSYLATALARLGRVRSTSLLMYICFWCLCVYNYVSGVCVYNYVSGVGVYNYVSVVGVYILLVQGYECV